MRRTLLLTALMFSAPLPALAQEPHDTFIEGGWLRTEPDAADDADGGFVSGAFEVSSFHFFGEFADISSNTIWEIGGGWHGWLGERADLVAQASVVDFESEDGYRISGGVRWMIARRLEINGFLNYLDFGADDDQSFEVNGIWNFARHFALGGGFESGDEFDWLRVFVRFNLGRDS